MPPLLRDWIIPLANVAVIVYLLMVGAYFEGRVTDLKSSGGCTTDEVYDHKLNT